MLQAKYYSFDLSLDLGVYKKIDAISLPFCSLDSALSCLSVGHPLGMMEPYFIHGQLSKLNMAFYDIKTYKKNCLLDFKR